MRFYEATSDIAADPAAVWSVLIDGEGWPTWGSGVDAVAGQITAGARITVRSEAAPGRAFPVRVTTFAPPARLVFTGGIPMGLFRGVRTFTVTKALGGSTFRIREEYAGPLLPLIWRSMPDLAPSFVRFADGLKVRVQSGAQSPYPAGGQPGG